MPTSAESLRNYFFKDQAFQITGGDLAYNSKNKLLEINNTQINTLQSKINLSLKVDSVNNLLKIGLSNFQIQLSDFYQLAKVLMPTTTEWLRQGQANGNLEYQGSILTNYQVTGNLNLSDIKQLTNYQFKSIKFENLILENLAQTNLKASAKTTATGLQIANRYSSDQLLGDLTLTHNKTKGIIITGKPNFKNFGYRNQDLKLTNINANINPLEFQIDPQGNIESKLNLVGSSIKMTSPTFQIHSASKVTIPMTIKVPKKGAYNVSGIVSVVNGDVQYTKYNLKKLSGNVKVYLSSAKQSYESDYITFEENGTNSKLQTNLQILPNEFQVTNLQTDYFSGNTIVNGILGRKKNQTFQLKVLANKLQASRMKALFIPDHKEPIEGEMTDLTFDVHGLQNTIPKGILGNGEFKFVQPQASRTGIAKRIVSGLRSVPVVGQIFGSNKINEVTESQTLQSKLKFADNNCYFETINLSRPSYDLIGKGQLSHDYQLNIKADLIMLQESASKFGLGVAPLEKLFGRAGRVVIPIYIQGKLPDYKVEANMNALVQNNTGITLGKKIFKGIGNTIFGKD